MDITGIIPVKELRKSQKEKSKKIWEHKSI